LIPIEAARSSLVRIACRVRPNGESTRRGESEVDEDDAHDGEQIEVVADADLHAEDLRQRHADHAVHPVGNRAPGDRNLKQHLRDA
jgi:hypothetical protein